MIQTRAPFKVILLLLTAHCSGCSEQSARGDGGSDGSEDHSVGAKKKDAEPDNTIDAGPGWRPYTEIPGCDLQVATNLQSPAFSIRWIACPGNGAACLQADTIDWGQGIEGAPARITFAKASPKQDYFFLAHSVPLPSFQEVIYTLPSFTPVQAWLLSETGSCDLVKFFGDQKGAMLQILPSVKMFAAGGLPGVFTSPTYAALTPPVQQGQNTAFWSMSDTTVSFDIQPQHSVARLPFGQTNYVRTTTGKLSEPIVVADDVFAHDEYGNNGWDQIVRVNADGSITPFRSAPQRHVTMFRADANRMVWVETFGDSNFQNFDQPNAELWGAPYTNDPTTLGTTAKKIATLPGVRTGWGDARYFSGYYAVVPMLTDNVRSTLYVVRVADGYVKTIDVNALVGPDNVHPYMLARIASVSQTEVIGILSQVNWSPIFGLVKLQLGAWP